MPARERGRRKRGGGGEVCQCVTLCMSVRGREVESGGGCLKFVHELQRAQDRSELLGRSAASSLAAQGTGRPVSGLRLSKRAGCPLTALGLSLKLSLRCSELTIFTPSLRSSPGEGRGGRGTARIQSVTRMSRPAKNDHWWPDCSAAATTEN
jgi:hypothetical protein